MFAKTTLALAGAALAGALALAPQALAGTAVSVRVEGKHQTLLAPTPATTHGGWITKGGTPKGKCSAQSAAGALDVATSGNWGGQYTSYGLEVTSILGETHTFSAKAKYYWSVWVNNTYAQSGVCDLTLAPGEKLLFAAIPVSGPVPEPLGDRGPSHAQVGHAFAVKVVRYGPKGAAWPIKGAEIGGKTTNTYGIAYITPQTPGTLVLQAKKAGYIRAAPLRVSVSS